MANADILLTHGPRATYALQGTQAAFGEIEP